jgi:hypothetical protein
VQLEAADPAEIDSRLGRHVHKPAALAIARTLAKRLVTLIAMTNRRPTRHQAGMSAARNRQAPGEAGTRAPMAELFEPYQAAFRRSGPVITSVDAAS